MARQAVRDFQTESTQPFLLRDVLPGPAWAPYRAAARPSPRDTDFADRDYASGLSEDRGSCLKGMLFGLGLEVAAALGVFGVWQLWHLIR